MPADLPCPCLCGVVVCQVAGGVCPEVSIGLCSLLRLLLSGLACVCTVWGHVCVAVALWRAAGWVWYGEGLPRPRPLRRNLDNNQLTGSIPESFSKLTSLTRLCAPLACCARLPGGPACVCGAVSVWRWRFGGPQAWCGMRRGLPRPHPLCRYLLSDQRMGSIPESFSNMMSLGSLCAPLAC